MKLELKLSWRYLATKRKEKFISLISVISILGVAIGVTALIVVLAVMTGFDRDLRDKIVGNYSHITLSAYKGINEAEYKELAKKISAFKHVEAVSPYLQGQVLLKEENRFFAVGIKGIDPKSESRTTKIDKYMVAGNINDLAQGGLLIGRELAMYLGVRPGATVTLISPSGKQNIMNVAGIFSSGMYDYDMNMVFTGLKSAQAILGMPDKISALSIKLDDLYLAPQVRDSLYLSLGPDYILKTWTEANANFFAALKLEKLTMFIILTLIILVAAFNIASTLIVMVVEKTKDIGVLKALGMSSKGVRRVFIYQGLIIGLLGTLLGAFGGVVLCALLKKYQFVKLPQDIYYIDHLPVSIVLWPDIALIVLAAFVITLISTIYPASKASRLEPVEALRYE
ncbi:MAG: FtsX-like permease family protein [Candidatus Omnitrophota bacterium]|jgi:lipoprotein-releasing system permease protein